MLNQNHTDKIKISFVLFDEIEKRPTLMPGGAPYLKRAIERLLVQPLSSLMATGQIHRGDSVRVSHAQPRLALLSRFPAR